jgi:DNA-binding transcriptional MerR regulator
VSQPNLTIGALSAQTGSNIPTIRYYEQIGLLPEPERAANGHRYYRDADLKRLTFIKRCRDFGFPIEQVRALLSLYEDGDRSCVEARDMAQEHLEAVRAKLEELRQLEASLAAFVDSCTEACSGGVTRNCVIIEDLSAMESILTQSPSTSCCGGSTKNAPAGTMTATKHG